MLEIKGNDSEGKDTASMYMNGGREDGRLFTRKGAGFGIVGAAITALPIRIFQISRAPTP